MLDNSWLDRRCYGGDLPAAAERAFHAAAQAWHDEASSEGHVHDAPAVAPGHLEVQIAAYKFYFYRHRLAEALPYAQACLGYTLRRNNLPGDWHLVGADDAAFSDMDPEPRILVFSLVAYGYVLARLGRLLEGREALAKVAELDPRGRMGAQRLLAVLNRAGQPDDA